MDSPRALDLFINLWNQQMASEEAPRPGTDEYRSHKKFLLDSWARMWEDCVEIEKYLENREMAKADIRDTIERLRKEDPE